MNKIRVKKYSYVIVITVMNKIRLKKYNYLIVITVFKYLIFM